MISTKYLYITEKIGNIWDRGFHGSDFFVTVCFFLILTFGTIAAAILIVVFVARSRDKHAFKRATILKEKYELLLTGIIFNDEDEMESPEWKAQKNKLISHFKKQYLNNDFNRNVLCEQLLSLHRNFSGSSADVLRNLYLEFGFDKRAIRKLRDPSWSIKAKAVKELTQMQITDAEQKIRKLLRHENTVLRLEAKTAILILDKENPFSFLDEIKVKISEWHQVNLAYTIKKIDKAKIPNFSKWFQSSNESVVIFCIKMMVLHNQFEGTEKLVTLLTHANKNIVKEAIIAIGEIVVEDACEDLITLYQISDSDIQQHILLALGKISSPEAISFLEVKLEDKSFKIAFKAATGLSMSESQGMPVLIEKSKRGTQQEINIAKHLLDTRI